MNHKQEINTHTLQVLQKEGYEQIAALFLETAENEKEHAKIHFKYLNGISDKKANLAAAAAEKTTNGQICMTEWLKKLMKKVLQK